MSCKLCRLVLEQNKCVSSAVNTNLSRSHIALPIPKTDNCGTLHLIICMPD